MSLDHGRLFEVTKRSTRAPFASLHLAINHLLFQVP